MVDLLNVDNEEGGGQSDLVDQRFAFVARLENVKILSQLLKTINFRSVKSVLKTLESDLHLYLCWFLGSSLLGSSREMG